MLVIMDTNSMTTPLDRVDEDKLHLTISCPVFTAHCHHKARSDVWHNGAVIDSVAHGSPPAKYNAPFPFDIEFHDREPFSDECERLAEFLGPRFKEEFTHVVEEIFWLLESADDPLEEILSLDAESI